MIQRWWRLTEGGEENLGLACTKDGLVLGRTPLVERQENCFVVREQADIERVLSRAYRMRVAADRLMPGLARVASHLNVNDQCMARIAAVQLRMPDLPSLAARAEMEAEEARIRSADGEPALHQCAISKASPDDPKHPGWPAGTPGRRGGQFRPKGESELTQRVKGLVARRALRTGFLAALRIGIEALANLIPGVDIAADVAMVADIALTVSEFRKLAIDAAAALEFVRQGPYSLEDLQVSSSYQEFSSYDRLVKVELSAEVMEKWLGPAGDGWQYHHIVTQGGANADNFPPEQLHNTDNVIRLPAILHEAVNAEYLKPRGNTNMTKYQWLQTQPYSVQREEGLQILRDLHILK